MIFSKQSILPQQFAYKLDVSLIPYWPKLAERIAGSKTSEELEAIFQRREKNKDREGELYGRTYHFTEYFDTASGLIMRFQGVYSNGTTHTYPVDEFLAYGSMLGREFGPKADQELENKYSVALTEDSIRNNCFDKYIGGFNSVGDKEDYLVIFPLDTIVKFLAELGLRFHDVEDNLILKWPDHIETELKKRGFSYDPRTDYEPTIFDIEKHDKDFWEKNGRPKVSLYGGDNAVFTCEVAEYQVRFKMFRPKNNDRLGWAD